MRDYRLYLKDILDAMEKIEKLKISSNSERDFLIYRGS